MTQLTFRLATIDDVDALLRLVEAAYRGTPAASTWTTEADLLGGQRVDRQMMTDAIDDTEKRVIVATRPTPCPTADSADPTADSADSADSADPTDTASSDETGDPGTASMAGETVACCEVRSPDEAGNSVLGMFAVEPELQGSGLGRDVLDAGEREAAALGATAVELHVLDVRHELLAWYRRRGYSLTGEHVPFPYGDDRFGEPRRSDLRFAVLRKPVAAGD